MTAWYRAGTAAVNNGSPNVVGTLTTWLNQVVAGDSISFDAGAKWYEVLSVTDNTHLTLASNFGESNYSGSYAIQRTSPLWSLASELATKIGALLAATTDVLSGSGAPSDSLGSDGSIYIDTTNLVFYGPKAAGTWAGTATPIAGVNAGFKLVFDSSTSMADPGTGEFRLNNATLASVTAIAISDTSAEAGTVRPSWLTWDDSTTTATRGVLRLEKVGSGGSVWAEYQITAAVTDNTTWGQFTVSHIASAGTFTAADEFVVLFSRTGNTGATGAAGASPGPTFTYSTTTTMADPGAGAIRLNNATLSSVTAAAVDASSNASGNPAVRPDLLTWDDSTSTHKGVLRVYEVGSPQNFAIYSVTGVTDNTGWVQLALTYVTHAGSFAASDNLCLAFSRTGDAGAGDMTSTNNLSELANKKTALDNLTLKGADIASASTIDLDAATGNLVDVTGTTTINAITLAEGRERTTRFTGALQLTNGASLILPGAINRTAAAGDIARWRGYSGGVVRCVAFLPATGKAITPPSWSDITSKVAHEQGKHTVWIPAAAMVPRTTTGAAPGTAEMATNKNMVRSLDFDATTQEFAQFEIAMPKSWNLGTVTFQPVWSHPSTATNFGVVWALQAVATSDDDALDVAFGTEQTSTDTGGTTNDRYIGPESSAITIAGTPAAGDVVQFQIKRNPSDGSDTLAVDARLHGIKLYITTNAATDA